MREGVIALRRDEVLARLGGRVPTTGSIFVDESAFAPDKSGPASWLARAVRLDIRPTAVAVETMGKAIQHPMETIQALVLSPRAASP